MVKEAGERPAVGGPGEVRQALRFGQLQRRQLCVMFVDLTGSTELAANHDLEDTRDVLLAFLDAAAARIEAAHGFVARFMGDGLLAYFGYPEAHAEAATLALHAAREVQQAVGRLKGPGGMPLTARVGVATGEVMIGDIVGRGLAAEFMVVGAAANLAARLQSAAAPGAVLACEATRALAAEAFAYKRTEPLHLKGLAQDVVAYEVLKSRDADRFGSRLGLGLAPLVGREAEMARLDAVFGNLSCSAQQVLVTGEAGIGKSRLLHAFKDQIGVPAGRWLSTTGAATAIDTPYFGLAQLLRRAVAGDASWKPDRHPARLVEAAERLGIAPERVLRLAQAAGLSLGPLTPPLSVSSQELRTHLLEDGCELLTRLAAAGPVILAIEDAHWLDPSTTALLADLWPLLADLPILLLATSRQPLEGMFAGHTMMQLGALDQAALTQLAQHATGGLIDAKLLAQVTARAQGVPLFAEELARLLVQNSGGAQGAIPATLADLLMSRLDRSEHGLSVAQLAALLGEDSAPDAIAALAGFDSATLARVLDRLEIDGVVAVRNDSSSPVTLRHALFGEAALAAMPVRTRSAAHLAAARLLVERIAPADRIARHFDAANDIAHAAEWWQRAGDLARRRWALPEACGAYERAIDLTKPDAAAMLPLQAAHFEVLQLRYGYGADPTRAAGDRLRELVEAEGDLTEQLIAVAGQWAAASSAGEYDLANEHASRAPAIARALGTPDALASAAMIQLTARYRCGDLIGAEEAFQLGATHFSDPVFVARPGGTAQVFIGAAIVSWLLGDHDAFAERLTFLEAASASYTDPYSQAFFGQGAAKALLLEGQYERAERAATISLDLSERHSFTQFKVAARITLGAAIAGLGNAKAGAAMVRDGLTLIDATETRSMITLYLVWLAEAELAAGLPDYALGTLAKAQALSTQERFAVPELIRLRAHAEAAHGRPARRGSLLREALAAAEKIGAVGWRQKILSDIEIMRY